MTDGNSAEDALQHELLGSGSSLGYRAMTRRLLSRHGLTVPRNFVAQLQRLHDPDGVAARRRHNFRRRAYENKGPNYLVHVDGYDKLKPYGFPIHGAVCGFSRRDPSVVAAHFVTYMQEIQGVPRCVRIDAGTENVLIEDIEMAFRWDDVDDMAADKSVLRGSSHSNQRIERWWLSSKQGGGQFWIDLFKDLESSSLFSTINDAHKECARFCFMELIQEELNQVRMDWNQHTIRYNSRNQSPSGKPDLMFHLPHLYGTVDYKLPIRQEDIDQVRTFCTTPIPAGCSDDADAVLSRAMRHRGIQKPTTPNEALELYAVLLPLLDR